MNPDAFDKHLSTLFAEQSPSLPDEPFMSSLQQQLDRLERKRFRTGIFLRLGAIAILLVLFPYISTSINAVFALTGKLLEVPGSYNPSVLLALILAIIALYRYGTAGIHMGHLLPRRKK